MHELEALAELSHALERIALGLADDGCDTRVIAQEIETAAPGQREAMAIALSYLLRHRSLGTHANVDALANAIDAMVLALRRTR